MGSKDDNPIIVKGAARTVEYARDANGDMLAKEFFDGLEPNEKRRLLVLFERLAEAGRVSNTRQFRKLEEDIWEFKRGQIRFGCFQVGARWLLTHGFIKKKDRCPPKEIKRAKRIRTEHIERERGEQSQ